MSILSWEFDLPILEIVCRPSLLFCSLPKEWHFSILPIISSSSTSPIPLSYIFEHAINMSIALTRHNDNESVSLLSVCWRRSLPLHCMCVCVSLTEPPLKANPRIVCCTSPFECLPTLGVSIWVMSKKERRFLCKEFFLTFSFFPPGER